jgi:hypothetical protein
VDRLLGSGGTDPAESCGIAPLADRAFGNPVLYENLATLGWGYVIRFRECIRNEEASGLYTISKVDTPKRRTHSLYRQGLYWYDSIPELRTEWLRLRMTAYDDIVQSHPFFSMFFALPGPIDA